jgi:UDP-glucose 4-epimerase
VFAESRPEVCFHLAAPGGRLRLAGTTVDARHEAARPGELQRSVLDPALAERELGFRARTPLDEGLAAIWKFIGAAEGEGADRAN